MCKGPFVELHRTFTRSFSRPASALRIMGSTMSSMSTRPCSFAPGMLACVRSFSFPFFGEEDDGWWWYDEEDEGREYWQGRRTASDGSTRCSTQSAARNEIRMMAMKMTPWKLYRYVHAYCDAVKDHV